MSVAAPQLEVSAPIDEAQRAALAAGRGAARRFSFAVKLARWNGACLILTAVLTLLLSVFDPGLLLWAALLFGCGWLERRGGRGLRDYDLRAPSWLALNQLLLMAAVVGYAAWQLIAALSGQASLASELEQHPELGSLLAAWGDPQLTAALDGMASLYRTGIALTYAVLLVAALLLQGGAALYYFSRRKPLQAFLTATPPWVIQQLREAG